MTLSSYKVLMNEQAKTGYLKEQNQKRTELKLKKPGGSSET
jgi:hypothetical protein